MNKKFSLIVLSSVLVLFLSLGALLARTNPKASGYGYLTIFSNVIHLVDSNYVEQVDFNKVMDSAMYGMVETLDPESFFLKGKDVEGYKKELELDKRKAGLGLTISRRFGMITVISVDKNSPADEKKIKPGDFIRSINGEYVQQLPLYKINHLMKGDPGTEVRISIFKSALEKPEDFTLIRRETRAPYIESYVAQPKIGYLAIRHLLPGVDEEVANKLEAFNRQQITKLIVDLRGCTEEDRDIAVKVTDLFVEQTPIVQISGREGSAEKVNGTPGIAYRGEILVLIDYTTAGGAEIIAGALQDSAGAKTFGVRTFGRGGIQKLVPAGQNFVVLTTQKYLTPTGKSILVNGIEPSVPYKDDIKSANQPDTEDRMLNKALEMMRHPLAKTA